LRQRAYQSCQVELENDFARSEWVSSLPAGHAPLDNVLFAPLLLDGKAVGVLGLANKPGGFAPRDARLAAGFAQLAAVALLNSRNLQSLDRIREGLEVRIQERTAELVRINDSLRESEARYKTLVENIPQRIFTKDRNSVYISCNESFARDLGITPEESRGKTDYDFFPGETADKYRADDKRIMESGETESFEEQYMRGGRPCWVETTKTPLRDEDGETAGILGVFSDITERKLAIDTLREREERFRYLIDAISLSSIGLLIVDGEHRVRFMNQPLRDAFGDQTGCICYEGIGKASSPCGYCKLDEVIQLQKIVHYQPTTAIGKTYDIFAVPFRDTDGTTCKLEILLDITERLGLENALDQSRARALLLADILERSSQPFGIGYPDGRLGIVNQAFCDLTGYSEEELLSMDWSSELTPPEWLDHESAMLARLAESEGPVRYEKEYIRKNGTRVPIELLVHRIAGENGASDAYYAFVTDTTARKRKEAERRQLETQYLHAQKMEAIGRLAGGVAHDFNNMLGIIMGFADLALMKMSGQDPLRRDLQEIKQAAQRSADLTRQLLAFARKEQIAPRVVDLNALIGQSEKMLRRLLGEDIELEFIPGTDLWTVKADPSQVDQILANLAVNSRDAMPGVGRMVIETSNKVMDQEICASHRGSTPGEYVRITFSDTGHGMDKPTMERVFEPFFTTKGEGRGTGLGLATVYGIIQQNKGYIDVTSELGKGTTFEIFLPRVAQAVETQPEMRDQRSLKGAETILVIEDEEPILRLCQRSLEAYGYKVITATSPGEAILLVEKHRGDLHLLVTDVIMPGMNGKELKERIEILKPGIPVLYMSGYTSDMVSGRGVLPEGVLFVQKPFSPEGLARRVRDMLDSRG
jgi:PAS domain S-box-containing protein